MTSRLLRPGQIMHAQDVRSVNNISSSVGSPAQAIQTPQAQQSAQLCSSILANKNLDVGKFQRTLQERHQLMQMPSAQPTQFTYEDKGRYVGTMINGKREGFGEYFFPNGDYYKGLWVADSMYGLGYYRYTSSLRAYYGEFLNSQNHGYGTLTVDQNPPIVIYDGLWIEGLKHGKGVYVYSYEPLEYYSGNWEQGQKTGQGKYFKDGNEYQGEWQNNKRNGQGEYITKEGARYIGRWKNDQLEEATIFYPKSNGTDEYRGEVSRGLRNGRGIYTYADGGRYEGTYRDDLRQGKGKETIGSAIYEGDFQNDKKHGHGILYHNSGVYKFSNDDIYEGDFDEGRKHGPNCVYTWADHSVFQGSFNNDRIWDGTYTDGSERVPHKVISGNVM